MTDVWPYFTGESDPREITLPDAPPWRRFDGGGRATREISADDAYWQRARAYRTPSTILDAVNAALVLRRPLLVTGNPGTGKSTLAYRVAFELGLGRVLVWPINSRSTLREGLYDYDAIARLQDQRLGEKSVEQIGRYISLRALGTALLPTTQPRALLIDELDKADPDLPNDLLNVFEEGWYDISELQRFSEPDVTVSTADPEQQVVIHRGHVQCSAFPVVIVTSNGEREFPPAFLRRCVRVNLPDPDNDQLNRIVTAHLGKKEALKYGKRIKEFAETRQQTTATDQLLNALYIVHAVGGPKWDEPTKQRLYDLLTQSLTDRSA